VRKVACLLAQALSPVRGPFRTYTRSSQNIVLLRASEAGHTRGSVILAKGIIAFLRTELEPTPTEHKNVAQYRTGADRTSQNAVMAKFTPQRAWALVRSAWRSTRRSAHPLDIMR
jgi:hypothetical protein